MQPLNRENYDKWINNLLMFLIPLISLYLVSVIAVMNEPGHSLAFQDFIPNSITIGGMLLYILNALNDFLRKMENTKSKE